MSDSRHVPAEHALATRLPAYVRFVPNFESRSPLREIYRSVRVLRLLDGLDPRAVVHLTPPRPEAGLVSVVVPMFEARPWIDLAITSVLAQVGANVEVFCVDDCSTDDTFERVVSRFGADRRLCVVRLARNVGPYQIKNWIVARAARGRLIAFHDADDVSHPMRVREQQRWMDVHGFQICGSCVHQLFPPHLEPPVGSHAQIELDGIRHNVAFYETVERVHAPTNLSRAMLRRKSPQSRHRHQSLAFYGSQILERDLFLDYGGFDGHTRIGADQEFNWRVARCERIGNIPKVLYSRRFHDFSLTQHPETNYTSPARIAYHAQRDERHERIRLALEERDVERVRELCTSDLFFADVRVAEVHTGFDADLSV